MNSHGAVTVMRYAPARCAVLLHEGLTLDAAWGLLNADASSPPVVYIHRPMDVPQVGVA